MVLVPLIKHAILLSCTYVFVRLFLSIFCTAVLIMSASFCAVLFIHMFVRMSMSFCLSVCPRVSTLLSLSVCLSPCLYLPVSVRPSVRISLSFRVLIKLMFTLSHSIIIFMLFINAFHHIRLEHLVLILCVDDLIDLC